MESKIIKKKAKRNLRVAKKSAAKEAIGKIEKNTDTFILTYGQFSLIDALAVILDQTGPADVSISTWTAANAHIEHTAEMMEAMRIKSLRMIVDRSFETRQPQYCLKMRKLFGSDCIRAIRTHAKFMVIRSEDYSIVVRTSMNLNENPRLENIEISEDSRMADFFDKIVADVFSEVDPLVNNSKMLILKNLEESSQATNISCGEINKEKLNEPRTTCTI